MLYDITQGQLISMIESRNNREWTTHQLAEERASGNKTPKGKKIENPTTDQILSILSGRGIK